ncbi:MAG TPA: tetratricopeptide repeat protein [Tabrizicola sp.]|nr:tetratricopeptide repeat protein [Tabrizicola sp.]
MCSAVTTAPPALAEQLSHAVAQAIRQKDWPVATDGAQRLLALAPDRGDSQLRALQAYLQAGQVDLAVGVARASRPNWAGMPRLAQLAMLALGRAGDRSTAAEAGQLALQGDPQDLKLAATVADALTQAGRPSEAIRALTAAGVRTSDDPRGWYELARALQVGGAKPDQILPDARRALELDPTNLRVLELVARLSLDQGQPQTALTLLEPLDPSRRNPTVALLLVEAALAVGRLDDGLAQAQALAEGTASSIPMSRRITALLSKAGLIDPARAVYNRNLAHRNRRLPSSFAAGVAEILAQDRPAAPESPPQRIDWLWSQLVAAGRAPSSRSEWERELRQVTALDRLILDWIECRPEALADTTAIIDNIAPTAATLAEAQADGRGVFLAAAHVGLLFGSLAALAESGLPMAFVASVPNLGQAAHDAHLVSTSGQDDGIIGRTLYRAIKAGKVVSVAIEGGAVSGGTRFPLFDRMIPVSTFIPRLAWKTHSPSFFPLVAWIGTRARVSVTRLPSPERFRTVDAYETAWTRAYLKTLETALLDYPGSARVAGGFWGSINL